MKLLMLLATSCFIFFNQRAKAEDIITFGAAGSILNWTTLTDQIRGGGSEIFLQNLGSDLSLVSGQLRLLQGAGFASLRARKIDGPLKWNFSRANVFVVTGSGDGREYRVLLRDRSAIDTQEEYSYQATFRPGPSIASYVLPIKSFKAIRRGRIFSAPPLDLSDIVEIGIQVNDKNESPFALELRKFEAL
jgi:NADH dehydrogenase [ubiquinone] 1 alpha subcomplex assembly factor 1